MSNAFGLTPLHIGSASVALPAAKPNQFIAGSSAIIPGTIQNLTFGKRDSIVIPNGALAVSDPVEFPIGPGQVMTISIFLPDGQLGSLITSHPGSRTQTWMCSDDYTQTVDVTGKNRGSIFHWYFISGVDAWQDSPYCTLALIGDSITDGRLSTDNGNNRWPDLLFDRMQQEPATQHIAIVNQAAGGNRILNDGLGPNVLARIDRDILAQAGIKYVLIFEGLNDIGTSIPEAKEQEQICQRLIQAYEQLITRIHTFGIAAFGSTIPPFTAPEPELQPYSVVIREPTRQKINHWIRISGTFDAVVDFDAVLRDPEDVSRLNPLYNSGDYLHPNLEGFRALAENFPLELVEKFTSGVSKFR